MNKKRSERKLCGVQQTLIHTHTKKNNEIYHHGILNMHWGQRNGPPYPLKEGAHSAAEKKAGYQKSLGKGEIKSVNNRTESSNDIKQVCKKHGYKSNNDWGEEYYHLTKKNSPDIVASKDRIEPKEIDEIITNFSNADKKAIYEDCKEYCYKLAKKYWDPDISKSEFSKKFDEDYEFSSIWISGWTNNKTGERVVLPEVDIDMKSHVYSSLMGDHVLTTEYDKKFKKRASYGWSLNG